MQVILLREHKHARTPYPPNATIDVSAAEADWLIAHDIAGLPFIPGLDLDAGTESQEH